MTGKTHIAGGVALSLFLMLDFSSAIILCLGSILPDIDHENSVLGKLFPLISKHVKHRGIFHSLWIPIALFFLCKPLCYGYALHLFMDLLTVQGIKPFYPAKFRLHGFITTGSIIETITFVLLVMTTIFLIINNHIYAII